MIIPVKFGEIPPPGLGDVVWIKLLTEDKERWMNKWRSSLWAYGSGLGKNSDDKSLKFFPTYRLLS